MQTGRPYRKKLKNMTISTVNVYCALICHRVGIAHQPDISGGRAGFVVQLMGTK